MPSRAWCSWMLLLIATPASAQTCPPAGDDLASLQALREAKFRMPDPARRRTLATALLDCLGDPDPRLRDGIAYEALTQWMRAGDLDTATLRRLRDALYARLDAPDPAGFRRPFSALVLSEVARTDRIAPWMTADERDAMVTRAADYERSIDDYRGYDAAAGWRHGVAHGADWLWQLSLNPALTRAQADRVLDAVASQVMAGHGHAYVFGEPARLARPLLAIARRGDYAEADWRRWFAALTDRFAAGGPKYQDPDWLTRRHDLMAFLTGAYVEVDRSESARVRTLQPAIAAALERMNAST